MLPMASAPRTSRSGGSSASTAARIARAALTGSPGCVPLLSRTYARVGPTVSAYSGISARVRAAGPKKWRSNRARSSSSVVSSTAPTWVRPALLTRTSMRPKRSIAIATAASRWAASVTSRAATAAPAVTRSFNPSVLRAVASTASPRANAASAIACPKPLEDPVISQVRDRSFVVTCRKLAGCADEAASSRPPLARRGERRELDAVGHAELGVDVRQVRLDGVAAHEKTGRDLGVGEAIDGQPDNLELGGGEAGPARGPSAPAAAGPPGVGHGVVEREAGTLGPGGGEVLVAERLAEAGDGGIVGGAVDGRTRTAHQPAPGGAGGMQPGGLGEALRLCGVPCEGIEAVDVGRAEAVVDPDGERLVVQALGSLGIVRRDEEGGLVERLGQGVGNVQLAGQHNGPLELLTGGVGLAEPAKHGAEPGERTGDEPVVDQGLAIPGRPLEPVASAFELRLPEVELAQRNGHRRGDGGVRSLGGANDRLHELQSGIDVAGDPHDPGQVGGAGAEVVTQGTGQFDGFGAQPAGGGHLACEQGAVHLTAEGERQQEPVTPLPATLDRGVQDRAAVLVAIAIGESEPLDDQADVGARRVAGGLGVTTGFGAEPTRRRDVEVHVDVGLHVQAQTPGAVVTGCRGDVQALPGGVGHQLELAGGGTELGRPQQQPALEGRAVVGGQRDRPLESLDALVRVAAQGPQPRQGRRQSPTALGVGGRERPVERDAQVVVLRLQPRHPGVLVGTYQLRFRVFREGQEVVEMTVAGGSGFARFPQPVVGVLADGLQESVPSLAVVVVDEDQ